MEQNDNSVLVVSAKIPKNETLLVTVGPVNILLISPFNHAISSFSLLFKDTQIQKTSFFFQMLWFTWMVTKCFFCLIASNKRAHFLPKWLLIAFFIKWLLIVILVVVSSWQKKVNNGFWINKFSLNLNFVEAHQLVEPIIEYYTKNIYQS